MAKKKKTTKSKLTRRAARDLDVEISFLEGLVRRDPEYADALQILGDDYTKRGRVEDGLRVDQQLSGLCPGDPLVHYNLACSFSLAERPVEACAALDQAINLGYRDFRWLARDPDLAHVRRHPQFKKIMARINQMRVRVE
jgi:hypothetical protein